MHNPNSVRILLRTADVPKGLPRHKRLWGKENYAVLEFEVAHPGGEDFVVELNKLHPGMTLIASWEAENEEVYAQNNGRAVTISARGGIPSWSFWSEDDLPDEAWMNDLKFYFSVWRSITGEEF